MLGVFRGLGGPSGGRLGSPSWPKMAPARSQEGPWEGHGGVMGGPGALPRGSRVVLGRTWRPGGRPGEALGQSWEISGGALGGQGSHGRSRGLESKKLIDVCSGMQKFY